MRTRELAPLLLVFVGEPLAAQDAANWNTVIEADPFTDQIEASTQLRNTNGDRLIFACNGDEGRFLSIQYIPRQYLGTQENEVIIRFDRDPPLPSVLWEYIGRGTYTTSKPSVDWFSNQVGDGERIVRVRAYDFQDQPVDAEFISVNGRGAINQVRTACEEPEINAQKN